MQKFVPKHKNLWYLAKQRRKKDSEKDTDQNGKLKNDWLEKAKKIRSKAFNLGVEILTSENQLRKMPRTDLQNFCNQTRNKVFLETGISL